MWKSLIGLLPKLCKARQDLWTSFLVALQRLQNIDFASSLLLQLECNLSQEPEASCGSTRLRDLHAWLVTRDSRLLATSNQLGGLQKVMLALAVVLCHFTFALLLLCCCPIQWAAWMKKVITKSFSNKSKKSSKKSFEKSSKKSPKESSKKSSKQSSMKSSMKSSKKSSKKSFQKSSSRRAKKASSPSCGPKVSEEHPTTIILEEDITKWGMESMETRVTAQVVLR